MLNKKLIAALTFFSALTAHAQSLPPEEVDNTPAAPLPVQEPKPSCGAYLLEVENDKLTVLYDYGPSPAAVHVKSLVNAGNELASKYGLDVQTDEPKDWVAIVRKYDAPGKFALVIRDHAGTTVESRPYYDVRDCNDGGNKILNLALSQATKKIDDAIETINIPPRQPEAIAKLPTRGLKGLWYRVTNLFRKKENRRY